LTAYDASEWSDLFVAAAGAGAALAGLVFVAVSINIDRILAYQGLPERALETVVTLLVVVLVSIVGLIPGQSETALGLELLAIAVTFTYVVARASQQKLPPGAERRRWLLSRMAVRAIAIVPLLVAGISVLLGEGGGLYWAAAGIVGAIVGAVANAWVLLVEILR
jgi:modulator of FtsH protease